VLQLLSTAISSYPLRSLESQEFLYFGVGRKRKRVEKILETYICTGNV
jgi:hypothetical protein